MFSQVLAITIPVFGMAFAGFLYGRLSGSSMDAANKANMGLFVPVLLFYVLTEKLPEWQGLYEMAIGVGYVIFGSALLAIPIIRLFKWPERALLPSIMFNNSGNLGLPLAVLAYGDAALPFAVMGFVVSTVLHFSYGLWYVGGVINLRELIGNPVFVATFLGIVCNLMGIHLPEMILPGVKMLSEVAIPLMLVALGVRLTDLELEHWKVGVIAAVLCPVTGVIAALFAVWIFDLQGMQAGIMLLFGSLPPAVLNFLVAERFNQYPHEVASIVAFGNLAALITIPLILFFVL